MTAPKLTRIAWPKSEFATTGEWLDSLLPTPPPPPTAAEQRKAEADRRQHPPRGGADMTSLLLGNMYYQGAKNGTR